MVERTGRLSRVAGRRDCGRQEQEKSSFLFGSRRGHCDCYRRLVLQSAIAFVKLPWEAYSAASSFLRNPNFFIVPLQVTQINDDDMEESDLSGNRWVKFSCLRVADCVVSRLCYLGFGLRTAPHATMPA